MKKLMIILTAVAMSFVANAATVNWQSGTIYIASDGKGTTSSSAKATAASGANQVMAYLYLLDDVTEYNEANGMTTAELYTTYSAKSATASKGSLGNGSANIAQTGAAVGTYYAVILYVDTKNSNLPSGKTAFVKATVASTTVGGSSDVNVQNLVTSAKSSSWTAVPEPCSGLLMLVGMGALALRRRRA